MNQTEHAKAAMQTDDEIIAEMEAENRVVCSHEFQRMLEDAVDGDPEQISLREFLDPLPDCEGRVPLEVFNKLRKCKTMDLTHNGRVLFAVIDIKYLKMLEDTVERHADFTQRVADNLRLIPTPKPSRGCNEKS